MVHGNLSTGRFYEHLMPDLPGYQVLAPDMRGFGRSEDAPLDATRGLDDWADDLDAFLRALGVTEPVHLVGWSTAGAAIARFAIARPVASLTFIDPVSPYGFGGTTPTARPAPPTSPVPARPVRTPSSCSGCARADSPFSIRNVMNALYFAPPHREPPEREDLPVDEILLTVIGDRNYPGDASTSENRPGTAPGVSGILNALSPKYCDWSGLVDVDPKPPVLWTHGTADLIVADASAPDLGTLGAGGVIPGWPGAEEFPPQPVVSQIRALLERYAAAGGSVRTEIFDGSGHGPHLDATREWTAVYRDFPTAIGCPVDGVRLRRATEGCERTADPARTGPRAARALRPRPPAGLQLPARPLRAPGARRGPDVGDVPRRRRSSGRPAPPAARPEHRLAGRDRTAQARRPLARHRAAGARTAVGR